MLKEGAGPQALGYRQCLIPSLEAGVGERGLHAYKRCTLVEEMCCPFRDAEGSEQAGQAQGRKRGDKQDLHRVPRDKSLNHTGGQPEAAVSCKIESHTRKAGNLQSSATGGRLFFHMQICSSRIDSKS